MMKYVSVHVHVDADGREEQPGQPADREQADEAVGVEHRRLPRDRFPCTSSRSS